MNPLENSHLRFGDGWLEDTNDTRRRPAPIHFSYGYSRTGHVLQGVASVNSVSFSDSSPYLCASCLDQATQALQRETQRAHHGVSGRRQEWLLRGCTCLFCGKAAVYVCSILNCSKPARYSHTRELDDEVHHCADHWLTS